MTHKSIKVSKTLYVSQDFFQFLMNTDHIISTLLINLDSGNEFNFISPTEQHDKISYLPMEKYKSELHTDPYMKGIGRVSVKIGRFINKFLTQEVIETYKINKNDIERFVNYYKSWFDTSKYIFKVVEGEEIRKWYSERYYYSPNGNQMGSLWNSCMRYENRLKFLDMYCNNPNIKMLVMLQQVDNELLVRCRSLLWEDVLITKDYGSGLPNRIKVMDRIYYVFDSDVNTFKKWANENGYIPKYEQNAKSHQFFDIKGDVIRLRCNVKLDKSNFGTYPYLDTFPYFNWTNNELSNDEFTFNWDYKLIQADGSLERPQEQDDDVQDDW